MNNEDCFVHAIALVESSDNPNTPLGDHGRAAGRWQQHPSFYASWGPKPPDFHGQELTWDQAFEFAVRRFFREAPTGKTLAEIALAYHLHGQHIYTGTDPEYLARFNEADRACSVTVAGTM